MPPKKKQAPVEVPEEGGVAVRAPRPSKRYEDGVPVRGAHTQDVPEQTAGPVDDGQSAEPEKEND